MVKDIVFGILAILLVGCAGNASKQYNNSLDRNITLNLKLEKKGLASTNAYVYFEDFTGGCPGRYLGYLDLTEGQNSIGIRPGAKTSVIVTVTRKLLSNQTSFSQGLIVKPAPATKYELDVNYVDSMLGLSLYQESKSGRKKLPLAPLPDCSPED